MILADLQMAYASFKSTRVRSLLTVIGISIGVSSIVLVYSLGKGVQKSLMSSTSKNGGGTIIVTPGNLFKKGDNNRITGIDTGALLGASTLTEKDLASIKELETVDISAPIGIVAGKVQTPTVNDSKGVMVIASTPELQTILGQKVKFGSLFTKDDSDRNLALIGAEASELLFQEESPIGRQFTFRGTNFVVKGVLEKIKQSNASLAVKYDNSIFIPIDTAKRISGGVVEIREIQLKPSDSGATENTVNSVKNTLLKEHKSQEDFGIFKPGEYQGLTSQLLSFITVFVSAVAGISLFVGGVGVMNIMFVSVSERTKEIGVRKALGATSRQILGQFVVESIILSFIGGALGIVLALVSGYLIAIKTSLSPSFELIPITVSLIVSVIIGLVFGIAPAIKASRQDPIKSLRHH
jgi:putative ABC transport system permease protein